MASTRHHRAATALGLACATFLVALLATEGAYRLALADLRPLPGVPSEPPSPPRVQLLPVWRELGGDDPVHMRPIYPWGVRRLLPINEPSDPSARLSRYVALSLLASTWAKDVPVVPGWRQRARELALTVWVSRHWSARQALGALQTWAGRDVWSRSEP